MSADMRDTIAAATVGHADYVSDGIRHCTCGKWRGDSPGTRIGFSRHTADVVIEAIAAAETREVRSDWKRKLKSRFAIPGVRDRVAFGIAVELIGITRSTARRCADAALAELAHARTIATAEQLAALPFLAVVREEYESAAGWKHSRVWERRTDSWWCIAAPLTPPGNASPRLPVTVLWPTDWAADD